MFPHYENPGTAGIGRASEPGYAHLMTTNFTLSGDARAPPAP